MKTYKITPALNHPNGVVAYWIEITEKYFFNLFTRRKYIGDYKFDNGGAMVEMPFFSVKDAQKRINQLENK